MGKHDCRHLNTFDPGCTVTRVTWCRDCGALHVCGRGWMIPWPENHTFDRGRVLADQQEHRDAETLKLLDAGRDDEPR